MYEVMRTVRILICAILAVAFTKAATVQSAATTTAAATTTTTTTVARLEPTTLDLGVGMPSLTDPGANTKIFVDLMKVCDIICA